MKKILLLVLATVFTETPAFAIDMNAEVFVTHKATLTDGAQKEGTDVERFRIFVSNKFDDQWAFKGRFEFKSGALDATTPSDASKNTKNQVFIPEAHFVGTSVLMEGDTVKFGIMDNPAYSMESLLGTRWVSKSLIDDEGFAVNSTQAGFLYALKFGEARVTLFSLSGQPGEEVDSTDNNKLNGAMLDYKFGETTTVWLQNANLNTITSTTSAITAAGAKSTSIISAGALYRVEAMDLGFNYHQASYTVETGVAPKSNTAMALTGLFKKIGGTSTNLYAHYWTGFDKFADTGEATNAKAMIGPAWNLADNKINLGVFYQTETFQDDYKTANPTAKEPSAMYVKMAAKF